MSNKFFKKFMVDPESIKRISQFSQRVAHPVWDLHNLGEDVAAVRKTTDDFDLVKTDGASTENTYKDNLVPEQIGQYMVVYFAGREISAKVVGCDGDNFIMDDNGTIITVPKHLAKTAAPCPACGIDPERLPQGALPAQVQKPMPPDPRFGPGGQWDPDMPEPDYSHIKSGPIPDAEPTPVVDYQSLITPKYRS